MPFAMKINIIGNVVNFGYNLAKFLEEDGHEVKLFLFDKGFERDLPQWEHDSVAMPSWVVKHPGRVANRPLFPWFRIIRGMRQCDVVISTGAYETILAARTGRPHIFWSMGGDLDTTPFSTANIHVRFCSFLLRNIFRRCRYVVYSMPFQALTSIQRLHLINAVLLPVPWDTDLYKKLPAEEAWNLLPLDLKPYDLIVFAPARHQIDPTRYHYKGNEQILFAFRDFATQYQGKACLVFTRHGEFWHTEKLAKDLNINNSVVFIDMLNKQALKALCSLPQTVVCDQFPQYPRSGLGFIGTETLLCEGVLITAWDHDILGKIYDAQPPVFYARETSEIKNRIVQVSRLSKEQREVLGKTGREWAIRYHSKEIVMPRFESLLRKVCPAG